MGVERRRDPTRQARQRNRTPPGVPEFQELGQPTAGRSRADEEMRGRSQAERHGRGAERRSAAADPPVTILTAWPTQVRDGHSSSYAASGTGRRRRGISGAWTPTIRTSPVGEGTPTGTRSPDAPGVPRRPVAVLDQLADAILRQRNPERQRLPRSWRRGEPDADRSIERLQVSTRDRHDYLRLLGRKIRVPVEWDSAGVVTPRENQRERLGEGVLEVVGRDREGRRVGMENVAENVRVRAFTSNLYGVTEDSASQPQPRG